ncbi:MAG: non-ribosomal peptide synthetase [Cyanobacteria bacterium RYN_339]|nr:non-ribosomal peptide synthetase [Cyanobacteria bacterium RYN_339]
MHLGDSVGIKREMATLPSVRLSLGDRLLLGVGQAAGPVAIHYVLELDAGLEAEPLAAALADLLLDYPILATRVRTGSLGHRRRQAPTTVELIFHADHDAEREAAFIRRPWDLAAEPPLRVLVQHQAGHARLVAGVAHVAADALGSFLALDRLARRYTTRNQGATPEPALAEEAFRSFRPLLQGFRPGKLPVEALGGGPWATFMDAPLPCPEGTFRWLEQSWAPAEVSALRRWAKARDATLTELLVAGLVTQGLALWPARDPVLVRLPVNLRERREGVANVVGEDQLGLDPASCGDLAATLAAVRRARPAEGARRRALTALSTLAPMAWLPPAAFRLGFRKALRRPRNHMMSFGLSNAGDLGELAAFGGANVVQAGFIGQVSAPPGLFAWAATTQGRLTLVLGYRDPATAPARARALLDALVADFAAVEAP